MTETSSHVEKRTIVELPLCGAKPEDAPDEPGCGLRAGHVETVRTPHRNFTGLEWANPAQHRADAIKTDRVSELQAEVAQWKQRALLAEAMVGGVTSALETLFNAVPRRFVPPDLADRDLRAEAGMMAHPRSLPTCQHLHHDARACPLH